MPSLDLSDLRAVLAPFGQARPLPRRAFVDPELFEHEQRALFRPFPIPVAHIADLARPGDWVRAPIPGANLIVVRGADLELHALHATCLHRATVLCDGERGRLERLEIVCPYHGFAYATDGSLLRAPGAPPSFLAAKPQLRRAEVTTMAGGQVLVRECGGTAPAARALPPWLVRLDRVSLQRVHRTAHEVRANWKVCVGNFQESHHFPFVHPGLEARTPFSRSTSITGDDGWLGGVMDLADGTETVSMSGRCNGRPFVASTEDQRRVLDAYVFPLLLTSLQPDYLLTYRLSPLAVDKTLVIAEIHLKEGAHASESSIADVATFWAATNAEDRAICERSQRGLASRYGEPTTYAESEDGLHAFEAMVVRHLLADQGAEEA